MKKKKRELYLKYRPRTLNDIRGQSEAVELLQGFIENKNIPHCILLSGPTGCGKTTIARIIRRALKCGKHDYTEMNSADDRGIDAIRALRRRIQQAPLSGNCRVWLMDECHKITNDAQNALLKMFEEAPDHVYFILATTEPQKMIRTIRGQRSTEIKLTFLSDSELAKLLKETCQKESKKIDKEVIEKIVDNSEGSARKVMVLLNQVIRLKSKSKMLRTLTITTGEKITKTIAQTLFNNKATWRTMAPILEAATKEDPEGIRLGILGYARAIMIKAAKNPHMVNRAYLVIETFENNFYDSKAAGLAMCCYQIVSLNKK